MALVLTSLETNLYDAKKHCAMVNASVLEELATREAVQKQLQQARDAESAASQALAIVTDTAYVNTVKSSCGDIMTTASTVPPVVELSPAAVIADNALGAQVAAATAVIPSVAEAAAAATDPATAADAINSVASAAAGASGVDAASLAASVAGADTAANPLATVDKDTVIGVAEMAADMYIKQQTCGICDLDDAKTVAGILKEGAPGVAAAAMQAFKTGEVPNVATALASGDFATAALLPQPATAQYGMLAGQTFESEAALMAAQQAAIDTSKSANLALARQAGSCFADGIMTNLNNGTLTPDSLIANFDANMGALGSAIAGYVGAAVADVPGSNPCGSQLVTDYALGCASFMNTVNKVANGVNCAMSKATMLLDQAENIYRHGPEILIAMAETTVQSAANTAIMALRNAAATNCNIGLAVNVAQNTIASATAVAAAGITTLKTAKDLQGSVGRMINTCEHTDDIIEKGKWLVEKHPVVRTYSDILKGNCTNMTQFKKLCTNGIKYARVILGTERQNQLTSVFHTTANTAKGAAYRCDNKITREYRNTTNQERNKFNLYNVLTYAI